MSILVYTESDNGSFKKTAYETVSYAKGIADKMGSSVTALAINAEDGSALGKYGASKVLNVTNDKLDKFNAEAYADVIAQAAKKINATVVVTGQSPNDKYLAPILAVELEAGFASNTVALPESTDPFQVKRTAFTNKGFNITEINTAVKLIGLSKNAYGVKEHNTTADIEEFEPELSSDDFSITIENVDQATDKITIADA